MHLVLNWALWWFVPCLSIAIVFMVAFQAPLDLSVPVELSISTFYELLDLEYALRTLGALSVQWLVYGAHIILSSGCLLAQVSPSLYCFGIALPSVSFDFLSQAGDLPKCKEETPRFNNWVIKIWHFSPLSLATTIKQFLQFTCWTCIWTLYLLLLLNYCCFFQIILVLSLTAWKIRLANKIKNKHNYFLKAICAYIVSEIFVQLSPLFPQIIPFRTHYLHWTLLRALFATGGPTIPGAVWIKDKKNAMNWQRMYFLSMFYRW